MQIYANHTHIIQIRQLIARRLHPGLNFIKQDQLDSWIEDQIEKALVTAILPAQLQNFVSSGRDKPTHQTQNIIPVRTEL